MSDIIREIEAAQLKENVDQFEVGDTVKVYGKIKEDLIITIRISLIDIGIAVRIHRTTLFVLSVIL